MNGREKPDQLLEPLTPRENEILICIGEGLTNRQIAEQLTIALSTVKWYVNQIYSKLGVHDRQAAIGRARELGLLEKEGAIRHNLPLAVTPFVGREKELAALAGYFRDPQVRLITIVGPGGIGKTRLALEAASRELRSLSTFSDGVFFLSLAPLESAVEIVPSLAGALNIQFQDAGNEKEQILNYLRQKRMLLVMDNFEHLQDGSDLLKEINSQAAGVTLLVTSRERLQMRGEQLFPLGGLALPQSKAEAKEAPSAQLFLNISRRALPDFQLLEGDAASLMRICRLVEGMPLGLELAASWAGLLPLSEIAAEIERSLQVLSSENYDAPVRHRSMQAALDVSWTRLNAEQKRAFQELTVFRGGFTRAAALEVAGATLPLLVTLVNKSWLTYDRQKDRYFIHELLRQYGSAKLGVDLDSEEGVSDRHSAYFCTYLQERETNWFGPRQFETAAEARLENENIQRAWRRASAQGDYAALAQGLHGLCHFYFWEGRKTEGRKACRTAEEGLSEATAGQQVHEAQYLALRSQILAWESDFVTEMARRKELLVLSQQMLDRAAPGGGDLRAEQAFIYLQNAQAAGNKDYEAAIGMATLALELYREIGDRHGQAEALSSLGVNYLFLGKFRPAQDALNENLEINRGLEDKRGIAITLSNLGLVAQHQGHYREAEALHRQALDLHKQLQNRYLECLGLTVLSFTQSWAGDFTAARETAQLALEIDREVGNAPNLWRYIALALATLHLGRYPETVAMAEECLALAQQRDHPVEKGFALMFLGSVAFVEGASGRALARMEESVALMAALSYVYQTLPLATAGLVARAQGDYETARRSLAGVLRSGIAYGSTTPIMYCLPVAALMAADEGDYIRSMELYGLAAQFGHISNSRWFDDAACRELEGVRAAMEEKEAAAAIARGRELDVWQTAEAISDLQQE